MMPFKNFGFHKHRHPREGGDPISLCLLLRFRNDTAGQKKATWQQQQQNEVNTIPSFAGMTMFVDGAVLGSRPTSLKEKAKSNAL